MGWRGAEKGPPILKVAGLEDAGRVTDLLESSYPTLWRGVYAEAVLTRVLPLFCKAQDDLLISGSFFLVEDAPGGPVLGVGGWTRHKAGSTLTVPREGHVRHFAVHPDAVGRGVGRRIMEATLNSAQDRGIATLHCTSSLSAVGYYTAFGFETGARITIPIAGVAFPVVEMFWRG